MTLDDGAIAALASLMNVSAVECRRILISTIRGVRHAPAPAPRRAALIALSRAFESSSLDDPAADVVTSMRPWSRTTLVADPGDPADRCADVDRKGQV